MHNYTGDPVPANDQIGIIGNSPTRDRAEVTDRQMLTVATRAKNSTGMTRANHAKPTRGSSSNRLVKELVGYG